MNKIFAFLTLISSFAVVGLAQADRIGSRQWKPVRVGGLYVGDSSRAYLELDPAGSRFTGNTGCNQMFVSALIRGRRVDFSNIGTTKMACAQPRVRRVEAALIRALENADRYRQFGNPLDLYDRNRLVVRLVAQTKRSPGHPPSRVGLEDRKWILDKIRGAAVPKIGRTAFVVFDAGKGSAGGNSSCNVFGGSYSTNRDSIAITEVISTMRACDEDERMDIERNFFEGLREANRYEISGEKLMLYRNRQLLLTFDGERK